jgi:two-component system NtrC family sensor kinase
VTERKRAEAAQKQAQQLLTQIIDADPVPTLVINARHVVTHWNPPANRSSGCPPASGWHMQQWSRLLPQRTADHGRPDCIGADRRHARTLRHQETATLTGDRGRYEAEDFFPQMGDKGRWLYFTAAPLRNALGEVIGAIETLQDITERKNAETELLRKCMPT